MMRRILVIDDDLDIREAMVMVLEDAGYEVTSVGNGQEALTDLQAGARPCLILLDLMMPVMDGYEFRKRQSASPAIASIPVVVLSADGNIATKCQPLGVAGYLKKPVDLDALLGFARQFSS